MAAAVIDLAAARRIVDSEAVKRNAKIVDIVPKMIAQASEEHALYIFNVGFRPHQRSLGSLGSWYVPACEAGDEVSPPCKVGGLTLERIPTDMNKMSNRYEEALDIANDIMFVGRGYTPDLSMENWGLFIHDGPVAPGNKIAAAKKKLIAKLNELIARADNLERANKREEISNTPLFRQAADYLNVTRPWCEESRQMADCPSCGDKINVGSAICKHCDAVLDETKARKYFPKRFVEAKG